MTKGAREGKRAARCSRGLFKIWRRSSGLRNWRKHRQKGPRAKADLPARWAKVKLDECIG